MNRLKGIFHNNSLYLKALAVLTSGSLVGAVITVLQEIVQTRIFTAEDIGIYTYLLAIPQMFIGIISLRYDVSIVVEKDDHRALALVKLSFFCSVVVSVLVTAFYAVNLLLMDRTYSDYWYVIPLIFIMLMGYGLNNILNSYSNRCRDYKMISSTYVIRTLAQRGGVVVLGILFVYVFKLSSLSVLIMVFCYSVGLYFAIAKQSRTLRTHMKEIHDISFREIIDVMKVHRRQVYYSSPALFINSFSYSIISIIMEKLHDPITLGYYSVSTRVLGMPIMLISGNVAKVYIEEAATEYKNTGKFNRAFMKTFGFLALMALPMFLIMYFLAPPLCGWVFGSGWETAGLYIKILAPMFSFRLIGTAVSQSLVVCNKQGVELIFNICLAAASVLSGVLTVVLHTNVEGFLWLLSITRSLCYIGLIICVYIYSKGVKQHD